MRLHNKPTHGRDCICRTCILYDLEDLYRSDSDITRWEDDFIGNVIRLTDPQTLTGAQRSTGINILEKHGKRGNPNF